MLSAQEAAALDRGQTFKRFMRAVAALNGIYDDKTLGEAVGRNRAAVGNWWTGARPDAEVLFKIEETTGVSAAELVRFLYDDGPPPAMPDPYLVEQNRLEREAAALDADNPGRKPSAPRTTPHRRRGGERRKGARRGETPS